MPIQQIKKPHEYQQHELEFLHAELLTGLAFSGLARTATHPDKNRNRVNAGRLAIPSAPYPKHGLEPEREAEIKIKLNELRRTSATRRSGLDSIRGAQGEAKGRHTPVVDCSFSTWPHFSYGA